MPDSTITTLPSPRALEWSHSNGSNGSPRPPARPPRPKVKKLRLFFILCGLSVLAVTSTVFGMMMAVASDLPSLENTAEYQAAENSILLDAQGSEMARLTGNQNRILVNESEVSPMIKNAVIAVEDRRFYEHSGVDYLGIARALWADLRQAAAVQGGSTITQQFVKNALAAQGDRTLFQKLREAALAYHLERQWTKQKILTQYLNSVYFGNGAYGVEAAMRTYFPSDGSGPGGELTATDRVSRTATPAQAALLAALIASPAGYDPVQNPAEAKTRRDMVLANMLEQGFITETEYRAEVAKPLPDSDQIEPPTIESTEPYFTTWVTQQLVDRYGAGRVFGGGLRIQTTLDPQLQDAASAAASQISGAGPTASLVAIDNGTGEVRAMVGGTDYASQPFNLATNGHRQPGSAIKPFTLIAALEQGIAPETVFTSAEKTLPDPNTKGGFEVNNYEGNYTGPTTLRDATINSDNSIYAEVGVTEVGTKRIAALARRMGIRTPVSTNPAMTLGGLEQGLTPLEMTFAYATIANAGVRHSGSLASPGYRMGPVAVQGIYPHSDDPTAPLEDPIELNQSRDVRIFPADVGATALEILSGVVESGTGTAASVGTEAWGKTGTTENYGDAWFCGGVPDVGMTACVWVGYPDSQRPMKTEYGGSEVAGGTYPAEIWQDFMTSAIAYHDEKVARREAKDETPAAAPVADGPPPAAEEPAPAEEAPVEEAPVEGVVEQPGRSDDATAAAEEPAPDPAPVAPGGGDAPQGGGGGAQSAGNLEGGFPR